MKINMTSEAYILNPRLALIFISVSLLFFNFTNAQSDSRFKLWYNQPANASVKDSPDGWSNDPEWLKALPVGNGFLGAMIYGDVNLERIQLNEKSLWSGSPADNDNPDAAKYLDEIRKLLFAGKYKEATELTNKTQVCKGVGSGSGNGATVPFGCFQTLGDIKLDFHKTSGYTNYYRELDLINGIVRVKYKQDGTTYTRESFASYPDRALVIRLTADKPAAISFSMTIDRPEKSDSKAERNKLVMAGALSDGKGGEGMKYKVNAVPVLNGGSLTQKGNQLEIKNATAATLIITAATDYRLSYPDYKDDQFEEKLETVTRLATAKKYETLRADHVKDFHSQMSRSELTLGELPNDLPTNELLARNSISKNEPGLYALYYQYGRYLLLSSSRKGSLPANLQGIWANKIQTPWNGDYHTNINVQMNYWPAEVTNLSDCHLQLIDLIRSLVKPGTRTAKIQYDMNGWCVHPITNVWGYTAPGEHPSWGLHVAATAWICQHLWEHYAFTGDKVYLKSVWPVLQESCRFYFDWLVVDPVTGKLVSGPASSPENTFIAPDGSRAQISMGPAHDQEVIYNLFKNTLTAAESLNLDRNSLFFVQLKKMQSRLARPTIGSDGRLMEWASEFKEVEPKHRHVSHLFALFPGDEISVANTPELASAARKSLEARGDGANGWSLAWKMAFWARLHEGDRALDLLNNLLRPLEGPRAQNDDGGSYYNLFDACPPFQIDGNFGATAGIAEMLLQSQDGFIELLPALPGRWQQGKITGLVARGNFVVDISWKNNKIENAFILSRNGGSCKIKYGKKDFVLETVKGKKYNITNYLQ